MITGANGTVGSALAAYWRDQGYTAVSWNRAQVPVNDDAGMFAFLRAAQPDVLFHLAIASQSTGLENEGWIVNRQWPRRLAQLTHELGIRMVFTSSVMVFTDDAKGPFSIDSVPDAQPGSYGHDKLMAEQDVLAANPNAVVARLGWQIGDAPGSNNMVDFLHKQMAEHGEIRASGRWYPACSFVRDTAVALTHLAQSTPGLYLVDSNTRWTFYEIISALNALHSHPWRVVETADFVYDQRMMDERVPMPALDKRLPYLAG